MKKNDVLLILIALILIAGIYIFTNSLNAGKKADSVLVYSEESVVATLSLYEECERVFTNKYGTNTVLIKDAKVSVIASDCKNQVCVDTKDISKVGESIVCLPHHFYVEIIGEKEAGIEKEDGDIDAIAN